MNIGDFKVSVVLLLILLIAVIGHIPNKAKLDKCEAELPRNQYCELIAVPVEP